METEGKELLLFQLGPVQEFIAQAATVDDLWAGSYLLSKLVWVGLQKIPDKEGNVVFPDLSTDTVRKALEVEKIPTIPNRFLAWVPAGQGKDLADAIKKAVKVKLEEYVGKLKLGDLGEKAARKQVDQFLQMTWAVLPIDEVSGNMGDDYKAIGRKLAMRRNVREFAPWEESLELGRKDFLSGKETAIRDGRSAMNLIKQILPNVENRTCEDLEEKYKYIAVIAMDGDRMGENLSSFENEEEHRAFSAALAQFAGEVEPIVKEFHGVLIYDGGDDVLAVVPAQQAIDCTDKLQQKFGERVKGKSDKSLTASAGIAVGHRDVPLQDLVHKAHTAESRAKSDYHRNALAVSVFKRSGEILEWGCKWGSKALYIYRQLRDSLDENLSGRFPYKLAELLQPYGDITKDMKDVVLSEFEHAWERSTQKAMSADLADAVSKYLGDVFGESGKPKDFLDLFLCETFIDRPREGEDND
ncbi:MAG: type III-B CRISPR-associated protein Cas10/Cmr2 [Kiritimatiellae bacterium]|nr:type III-B CRISPR-associated protein Cas10/Cmr2 [Kiritimatiellia bacterium]